MQNKKKNIESTNIFGTLFLTFCIKKVKKMNTNTLCYFLNNGVKGVRISDLKYFLMTSSEWKRQKLSEIYS